MRKVAAQLVLTAGLRLKFNQAVARGRVAARGQRHLYRCQPFVVGHRQLRIFIGPGKFVGNFVQLFHQRIIQHGLPLQPAAHHGVIALLNLMLFKLAGEQVPHFARQAHQQDAGGGTIQAVNGEDVLPNLIAHGLHHHHFLIAIQPATVDQPARGLINGDQPLVLIKHFQRHASSPAMSLSRSSRTTSSASRPGWVLSSAIS